MNEDSMIIGPIFTDVKGPPLWNALIGAGAQGPRGGNQGDGGRRGNEDTTRATTFTTFSLVSFFMVIV